MTGFVIHPHGSRWFHPSVLIAFLAIGLVSCSYSNIPIKTLKSLTPLSFEDLLRDHQEIPLGYIVKYHKAHCHQDQPMSSFVEIHKTYQDVSDLDQSSIGRFFDVETQSLSHDSSLVSEFSELKTINHLNGDIAGYEEDLQNFPQEFEGTFIHQVVRDQQVDLAADQHNSYAVDQVFHGSKGKGKAQVKGKSTGKSGHVGQNPDQGRVHNPKQAVTSKWAQHQKGIYTGAQQVSQGGQSSVQGKVQQSPHQKAASVHPKTVHYPHQSPLQTQKGVHQGSKSRSTQQVSQQQVTQSGASQSSNQQDLYELMSAGTGMGCQGVAHYFKTQYRPVALSSRVNYHWGYFATPRVVDTDDYTYFIYSKPTCANASWCPDF